MPEIACCFDDLLLTVYSQFILGFAMLSSLTAFAGVNITGVPRYQTEVSKQTVSSADFEKGTTVEMNGCTVELFRKSNSMMNGSYLNNNYSTVRVIRSLNGQIQFLAKLEDDFDLTVPCGIQMITINY